MNYKKNLKKEGKEKENNLIIKINQINSFNELYFDYNY